MRNRGVPGNYLSWKSKLDPRIVKTLLYILKNMNRPVRISELARNAGLSESHFSRAFLRAVGCGPHQFIKGMRLLKARRLVETTSLGLKAIAASFGTDLSHFNREFSKAYGKAPEQLRRLGSASDISKFQNPRPEAGTNGFSRRCCGSYGNWRI